MRGVEELEREITDLRQRLSRFAEASLRINETLDFDDVLRMLADSARSLTDARYGAIVTFEADGKVDRIVTSGFSRQDIPGRVTPALNREYVKGLVEGEEPGRLSFLLDHAMLITVSLGIPCDLALSGAGLIAPMHHHGRHVGSFYLADRSDESEFTPEDEETLVMFASQAALVIANARRHREEQRARADLETLVNTAPVGVVVFDARTANVVSINQEMRRIVSGLHGPAGSTEQVLGLLTLRRTDGREVSFQEYPLTELLSIGETLRAEEIVLRVPDGRSITTLLNATPIRSEDGTVESLVITFQDMTPMEELERLRAEFLGMVSHELRTPLSTIKGSADTLLEAASELDPAEMAQFHRIIRDQSDNMRYLIADLLDVARIETGTLPVNPEPTAVRALVDEARSRFQGAGGRNELHMGIPPGLPQVMADRRRILQVLGNLLSNAARHSHSSSTIEVSAEREGVHVAISVSDSGVGLSEERLPHLFRKFSRLEGEGQVEDTGLGLAICKGIVEAHGGRIWAESDGPGMGSRFIFTVPAVEGVATGTAPVSTHTRCSGNRRPRILCVDDDPQMLRYVRDALTKAGYVPIVTADPKEVLRLVNEHEPSLVLLDLVLPGTDGIELMRVIREIADVPVIFLSVYGQEDVVARAFDMGAADYVVKPFSPTELSARIRAALRRRAVPEPVEPSEPYLKGDLAIDYAERRVTVAGRPVELTGIEYRMLAELSASGGRVLTNGQLLHRVWGPDKTGGSGPVRDIIKRLRRKLGDDADSPTYIFNEPRVGYLMPRTETQEQVES